jgi:TctA family transporter
MPSLRRSKPKSKKERAAEAAKKAAKGVAVVQVAKRTPKRWLPIAGAAIAALIAVKVISGRHSDPAAA